MGRPPLSREATREVTIRLIKSAQELMISHGADAVTIRLIAAHAGLNSAVLYRYFKDLDELLLFACVDILEDYCGALLEYEQRMDNPTARQYYIMTWEVFSRYAFENPDFIQHLFFSRHSEKLDHVVSSYYDLFPEQLEGMPPRFQEMLREGDFRERNLKVLLPVVEGRASEERIQMINDMTVGYFYTLFMDYAANRSDAEKRIRLMVEASEFLLDALLS